MFKDESKKSCLTGFVTGRQRFRLTKKFNYLKKYQFQKLKTKIIPLLKIIVFPLLNPSWQQRSDKLLV